jgi:8-oxo-dGTP diphosphatase
MPIKIAARAVIIHNKQLLVVKHHGSSFYALPGGKRESDESLQAALVRELHEELGVAETQVGEIVCINEFEYEKDPEKYSLELFFQVTNPEIFRDLEGGSHTEGEIAEILWISDMASISFQPVAGIPLLSEYLAGKSIIGKYLSQMNVS